MASPTETTAQATISITDVVHSALSTANTDSKLEAYHDSETLVSTSPSDSITSTETHKRPYSTLPYHRPLSSGQGWGEGHGNIGDPKNVVDVMAVHDQYQSPEASTFRRYGSLFSGVVALGVCAGFVFFFVFLGWAWDGCPMDLDLKRSWRRYRRQRRQKRQEKAKQGEAK